MPRQLVRILLLVCCAFALHTAQAAVVVLYTYHIKPPYIVDADKEVGLYYDLASWLNKRTRKHHFKVEPMPRKRLDAELEAEKLDGLVIGVNPVWFKDKARTRYLWTQAFMSDIDLVVSRREKPIPYSGPESLTNLRIGLPAGYYYFGVDELVKAGKVIRDDAANEGANLQKLASGRVDAIIVSRPTLDYFIRQQPAWQTRFSIADIPHDAFDRHILIPKTLGHLLPELNAALANLGRDPEWKAAQDSYR
ncbi:ABC transporter substrate-binding protein [Chitinimonas sp. BJYL2]|uniref:substrate-binding periplasmic protein n=1 Tax=Chitinimonas sp. BJYL2 TaxID=2976696 RepID=UPI0022B2D8F6|nr:transporter substrate-binding domain-containing protein [Chitinimonas sp. BJYL2]